MCPDSAGVRRKALSRPISEAAVPTQSVATGPESKLAGRAHGLMPFTIWKITGRTPAAAVRINAENWIACEGLLFHGFFRQYQSIAF